MADTATKRKTGKPHISKRQLVEARASLLDGEPITITVGNVELEVVRGKPAFQYDPTVYPKVRELALAIINNELAELAAEDLG